jgi:hypothetical protein
MAADVVFRLASTSLSGFRIIFGKGHCCARKGVLVSYCLTGINYRTLRSLFWHRYEGTIGKHCSQRLVYPLAFLRGLLPGWYDSVLPIAWQFLKLIFVPFFANELFHIVA